MCNVAARPTIYFVGNHTAGYLWSVLSQLPIPVGQILICDLPLNIKDLNRRQNRKKQFSFLCWHIPSLTVILRENYHFHIECLQGVGGSENSYYKPSSS